MRYSRIGLIPLLLLATACGKSGTAPSGESRTIGDFLSAVAPADTSGVTGTSQSSNPPAAAGGPTATVSNGDGNFVDIRSSALFQTVFVSIGFAQTARTIPLEPLYLLAARSVDRLVARLAAATIETSGFMRVDLPTSVTEISLFIKYNPGIPSKDFDLRFQVGAPGGGPAGPVATVHKAAFNPSLIEFVGSVCGRFIVNMSGSGPDVCVPVGGAVVSTSLDSRTTATNASGWFDLVTNTPYRPGISYRLTITAAGWPTYSSDRWCSTNLGPPYQPFTLIPPAPSGPANCP